MDEDLKPVLIIITVVTFILLSAWMFCSYFEMRTFNKFSKKKADLIDAMFADLRVEASRVNEDNPNN